MSCCKTACPVILVEDGRVVPCGAVVNPFKAQMGPGGSVVFERLPHIHPDKNPIEKALEK